MPVCQDKLGSDINRLHKAHSSIADLNEIVAAGFLAAIDISQSGLFEFLCNYFAVFEIKSADEDPENAR